MINWKTADVKPRRRSRCGAGSWRANAADDPGRFNNTFDDSDDSSDLSQNQITGPTNAELTEKARRNPPPQEWYDGDEEKPF